MGPAYEEECPGRAYQVHAASSHSHHRGPGLSFLLLLGPKDLESLPTMGKKSLSLLLLLSLPNVFPTTSSSLHT